MLAGAGPVFTTVSLWSLITHDTVSVSERFRWNVVVSSRPSWFGLNGFGETEVICGSSDATVKLADADGPSHVSPATSHSVTLAVCEPSVSGVVTVSDPGSVAEVPIDVSSTRYSRLPPAASPSSSAGSWSSCPRSAR